MKKFSKEHIKERDLLVLKLRTEHESLESKLLEFNDKVDQMWAEVEEALTAYNQAVSGINDFASERAIEITEYMDERSDAWRDGENGERYANWLGEFENFESEEVALDKPDTIEAPECIADDFEALPISVDEAG